ncbi:MAG: class I SAM-dependent methyltransferase [Bacillota bacterium]
MSNTVITEERKYWLPDQELSLTDLDLKGRILDIGGGGEGIIGRIFPERVVAIDPIKRELEETPEGPLKIIMDGKDLKFLDNSFETVTSLFTLMFIKCEDHEQVLREAYRVLKPNGELHIWDIEIPEYDGGEKDLILFKFKYHIPQGTDNSGYGTRWPGRIQNIHYFRALAEKAGFKPAAEEMKDNIIYLKLIK